MPRPFIFITPRRVDDGPAEPIDSVQSLTGEQTRTLLVPDGDQDPAFADGVLSEYTQLFALARLLTRLKVSGSIYLFQYRKFIGLRAVGQPGLNAPFCRLALPGEMSSAFPTVDELSALNGRVLRGVALHVGSVAAHYSRVHHIDDLCLFAVTLREQGLLSADQVARFLRAESFVPAAALGMFPAQMIVRHAAVLRKAWQAFRRNYYVPRAGAQSRVGGFLLERLQSFLISEDVAQGRGPGSFTGHQLVASDAGDGILTQTPQPQVALPTAVAAVSSADSGRSSKLE